MNVSHPEHPLFCIFSIVVSGGQEIILAGDAATINFDVKQDAPLGETYLILSNLAATDPNNQSLDVLGNDGSVDVVIAIPTLSELGIIIFMTVIMVTGVMI